MVILRTIRLVLLGLLLSVNCPAILIAQQDLANPTVNCRIKKATIESIFHVKAGKLTFKQGSEGSCKRYNSFLMNTLNREGLTIYGNDYEVYVRKIDTDLPVIDSTPRFILFEYWVDFKGTPKNERLNQFLRDLKTKTYISRDISNKRPGTCHYLVVKDRLVLLAYYGLCPVFDPDRYIQDMKKRDSN